MSRDDSSSVDPPQRLATALRRPTQTLDHRVHAFRRDLADIAVADRVIAAHYAAPVRRHCASPAVAMRAHPSASAAPVSELLYGEAFDLLESASGWAWGRSVHDGYVGYLPSDALRPAALGPTHRVGARLALVFEAPSIKSPVTLRLPLGALVHAEHEEGPFVRIAEGFVHRRHLAAAGAYETDPVTVAERLLGAPYGWGGRSEHGVDCSGLVQLALFACGIACPRDTDQQRDTVGHAVDREAPLRRGDLVYFPGHVGLMADGANLLHANAFWMSTVIEPLADVVARLALDHPQPVLAVRRL